MKGQGGGGMEWQEAAVVLTIAPYGEGDVLASVLAPSHGVWRGLARGGAARAKAAIWQPGNVIELRWAGRLAEQLGSFTAELAEPVAARAMADGLALAVLSAACALTAGSLAEREPHPRVLAGLLRVLACMPDGQLAAAELVRFELLLLAELGFGLELASCALSGAREDLAYVSPRTGRAVARQAAGEFAARLLPLPQFLLASQIPPQPGEVAAGLRLTGHFLARDAFGARHLPLPAARMALAERLAQAEGSRG